MSNYEFEEISKYSYNMTKDEKKISVTIVGVNKFGIEDFNNRQIINIEFTDKKKLEKIFKIESEICKKFKDYKITSCLKLHSKYPPLIRGYIKYDKSATCKTLLLHDEVRTNISKFQKNKEYSFELYLDHLWIRKKNIGLFWIINCISD